MSAFDDLMTRADRESHEFTYDLRNALKVALTRSEYRRIHAMIGSATMAMELLQREIETKIAQAVQ